MACHPLKVPTPFKIIESVSELQRLGRRMNNCLAGPNIHDWYQLAAGSAVYVASDAPPLVPALNRAGPRVWVLAEARGVRNAHVPRQVLDHLTTALRDAGLTVLHVSPRETLGGLSDWIDVIT